MEDVRRERTRQALARLLPRKGLNLVRSEEGDYGSVGQIPFHRDGRIPFGSDLIGTTARRYNRGVGWFLDWRSGRWLLRATAAIPLRDRCGHGYGTGGHGPETRNETAPSRRQHQQGCGGQNQTSEQLPHHLYYRATWSIGQERPVPRKFTNFPRSLWPEGPSIIRPEIASFECAIRVLPALSIPVVEQAASPLAHGFGQAGSLPHVVDHEGSAVFEASTHAY
jgi:hypothetical protein